MCISFQKLYAEHKEKSQSSQ